MIDDVGMSYDLEPPLAVQDLASAAALTPDGGVREPGAVAKLSISALNDARRLARAPHQGSGPVATSC
jgi:hypothetical protein